MMYMVDMGSNAIKDECKLEFHIEKNEKKSFLVKSANTWKWNV